MKRFLLVVIAVAFFLSFESVYATTLVGLRYNQDKTSFELHTIDVASGLSTFLSDMPNGIVYFDPLELNHDKRSAGFLVDNTLHEYNLTNGNLVTTTELNRFYLFQYASPTSVVSMSYNTDTQENELYLIEIGTGRTTLLRSFSFDSGSWNTGSFMTLPEMQRAFALSGANTLYEFDLTNGNILSTRAVSLPPGTGRYELLSRNSIAALAYNDATGKNELYTTDIDTGRSTLLKSFTFDTGYYSADTFTVNRATKRAYVMSSIGTLYEFDLTNGNILSTRRLDGPYFGARVLMETVVPTTSFVVGMGSDPATSSFEATPTSANIHTARVPLGTVFFIKLVQGATSNGSPLKSFFTLNSPHISPDILEPALFPNNVLIAFEEPTQPAEYAVFQAVHRGTITLNIAPDGRSSSPFQLTIEVTSPRSLGTTYPSIDATLVDLGHRRGIPPHLLKGQVERESSFTPTAYRYEPLSVDKAWISRGQNLRETPPYLLYRMATADGLSQGVDILNTDIEPRSRFYVVRDGVRRLIAPDDAFVSAKEIYQENDSVYRWSAFSPATAAEVQGNSAVLDFTAQTPLASSFGYLQILYSTADKPMWWSGVAGQKNPSFLFDTEYNRQSGGGSLALGTAYLRRIFSTANPEIDVSSPKFANPVALERAFTKALGLYNGRIDSPYANAVLNFARAYLPIGGKVFP